MNSIRKRLLRWLLVGQLLAVVLTSAISFFYVRNEIEDLFDDRLRQFAYSVPVTDQLLLASPPLLSSMEDDAGDFVIQIWHEDGRLLLHLNRQDGNPDRAAEGYSTHLSKGMLWRSFVLHRGHYLVQASQPMTDRLETSLGIALGATAPILLLIVFLGGLVWVGVGRGLQPLKGLAQTLDKRSPYSLEPLVSDTLPVEIRPLSQALNGLLERLGHALEGQRKFIADAAHELRTPLTAVQLQVQLLERCHDEVERSQTLEQLHAGIFRASHLVQQLLTLARMEPDDWQRPFSEVDLSRLVKSVIMDHTPVALDRQIDLGLSRDRVLKIFGDGESLRVMLNNLIDNAIRYTPECGQIDIALDQTGNVARIEIQDSGPGIPVQMRQQVFSRFYRQPGSRGFGSGLGLAIVQEIITRHQGDIQLADADNATGLKVSITLPTNKDSAEQKA